MVNSETENLLKQHKMWVTYENDEYALRDGQCNIYFTDFNELLAYIDILEERWKK